MVDQSTAEARVVKKYNKLYDNLLDLVKALQVIEPGGTLVDDVVFSQQEGKVRLAYVATPIQVTIDNKDRRFILRVIEKHDKEKGKD